MSPKPMSADGPLPPGTRLMADPSLRRRDGGRLAIGGSPLRFLRLTEAGAATLSTWLRGEPVGAGRGRLSLARRLCRAGMLHPVPPVDDGPGNQPPSITIVVPVKDDPDGLDRTLSGLDRRPTIVVDDGSHPPVHLEPDPARRLVRRSSAGGPGVARQDGLALVDTPLVAFVDAGVRVDGAVLDQLGRWFADADVVAVGPRVATESGTDPLSVYERRHSPLDLGPNPAAIGPESPVTYLPTACLVARTEAVCSAGGFDPALRWGEDVDLVWRLAELGTVRYDPSVLVEHAARTSLALFVWQRVGYGSAAGPLAARHGARLAPSRLSGWSLACWLLVIAGRPALAATMAIGTAVALRRKLSTVLPDSGVEAALLTARGHWQAGRSLTEVATRAWWPLTAAALIVGPRRPATRLVLFSLIDRIVGTEKGPARARGREIAIGIVDDAAYGFGVWRGSLGAKTVGALRPKLAEWPPGDES